MLVIARDSTAADSLRAYAIYLDGKKISKIRDAEIQEFNISQGSHKLFLSIDWATSKQVVFEASDDYDSVFQCYSSVSGENALSRGVSVFSRAKAGYSEYITLEQVDAIDPVILERIDYRKSHPFPSSKQPIKAIKLSVTVIAIIGCLIWLIYTILNS